MKDDSEQPEDAAQQQQTRTAAIVLTKEEEAAALARGKELEEAKAWLPDGCSQIFISDVLGPSGFWTMAPLRYAAKFDPFLSLDCVPPPSTVAQSKERKGPNFAA